MFHRLRNNEIVSRSESPKVASKSSPSSSGHDVSRGSNSWRGSPSFGMASGKFGSASKSDSAGKSGSVSISGLAGKSLSLSSLSDSSSAALGAPAASKYSSGAKALRKAVMKYPANSIPKTGLSSSRAALLEHARRAAGRPGKRILKPKGRVKKGLRKKSGRVQTQFSFAGTRRQANELLKFVVEELRHAKQQVRALTEARFGFAGPAILQGLDACAALTFVAVSYSTIQCTQRSRPGHDCGRYAAPLAVKHALAAAFRGLIKGLLHALSRGKAPRPKTWERHLQVLYHMHRAGVGNAEAAPYISEVHSRLLEDAPRLLREATLAATGASKDADGTYFVQLRHFFAAVRRTAKAAKGAFARPGMLSPAPGPLAAHARAITSLGCSRGSEMGAVDALHEASKRLSSTGDELFDFLAEVLSAIAANSQKIWNRCATDAACKQRLVCALTKAGLKRTRAAHSPELVLGQGGKKSARRH